MKNSLRTRTISSLSLCFQLLDIYRNNFFEQAASGTVVPPAASSSSTAAAPAKSAAAPAVSAVSSGERRPLLPKSSICRLLAELVRSYAGCARLVAEHTFPAKMSDLVAEETTALAFLLDNLLPSCQTAGDKESPALVRTLIASLAWCNHAPDAQNALVAEVKASLGRALQLPESNDKHNRSPPQSSISARNQGDCFFFHILFNATNRV